MLFITAQSFVGIHLPFFWQGKTLQKLQCLEKSQSQANGSRVFIFYFWWAYSYTAITVRIQWPVPGQVYHFCIKLTVNCWRRLYLIENLPAIMIFWRIPFDNRGLHADISSSAVGKALLSPDHSSLISLFLTSGLVWKNVVIRWITSSVIVVWQAKLLLLSQLTSIPGVVWFIFRL